MECYLLDQRRSARHSLARSADIVRRVFDNAVAEIFQVLRLTMVVTLDEGRKDRDKGIDDDDDGDDDDLKEKLQFNEMLDEEKEGDRDDDDDDSNDEKEGDDGEEGHPYSVISRRHSVLPLSIGSNVDKHILHTELVQPKYLQPPQLGHIITSMLEAWKKDKKRNIEEGQGEELMVMTMTGFRDALIEVGDFSE